MFFFFFLLEQLLKYLKRWSIKTWLSDFEETILNIFRVRLFFIWEWSILVPLSLSFSSPVFLCFLFRRQSNDSRVREKISVTLTHWHKYTKQEQRSVWSDLVSQLTTYHSLIRARCEQVVYTTPLFYNPLFSLQISRRIFHKKKKNIERIDDYANA